MGVRGDTMNKHLLTKLLQFMPIFYLHSDMYATELESGEQQLTMSRAVLSQSMTPHTKCSSALIPVLNAMLTMNAGNCAVVAVAVAKAYHALTGESVTLVWNGYHEFILYDGLYYDTMYPCGTANNQDQDECYRIYGDSDMAHAMFNIARCREVMTLDQAYAEIHSHNLPFVHQFVAAAVALYSTSA